MALHPGDEESHPLEELAVVWGSLGQNTAESKDWYRDLVEHSHDLLCVHDLQGRFLSINPVPARLLGYSVKEMLEKQLQDVIDPQYRSECAAYLCEIARTVEADGLMAVRTRAGEKRIWEYHSTLRTEGLATPVVRTIAHDVTGRVRANEELRASHERLMKTARERERILQGLRLFRTLLDQSNDAIEVAQSVPPAKAEICAAHEPVDHEYSQRTPWIFSFRGSGRATSASWKITLSDRSF
jgi:PAS domain S-box-containing protein